MKTENISILNSSLIDLGLSYLTYVRLGAISVETMGDLVSKKRSQIQRCRGIGKRRFKEIQSLLSTYNLKFNNGCLLESKSITNEYSNEYSNLDSKELIEKALSLLSIAIQKSQEETILRLMDNMHPSIAETPKEDKKLRRKDIKALYNISYPTIHNHMKNGILPFQRLGGKVYFLESDVEKSFIKVNLRKKQLNVIK